MFFKLTIILIVYTVKANCQLLNFDGLEAFELFGSTNESLLTNASFYIANSEIDVEHSMGLSGILLDGTRERHIHRGKVSFNHYLCWNNDINDRTVFNIGSITKFFSSALVLQLIKEKPELFPDDLNTKLSFYLPYLKVTYPNYDFIKNLELRNNYSELTLLNLLQHTSGIGNFDFKYPNPYADPVLKDESLMMNDELNDAIYGKFTYSNLGYNLVGMIIRSITNETLSKLMKRHVLRPMNLTETLTYQDLIKTDKEIQLVHCNLGLQVAQSYNYFNGVIKASQNLEFDSTTAGMYASLRDLVKFAKLYFGNEFWNEKQIRLRDTKPVSTDVANGYYGVGYFIYPNGEKGHSGSFMGAQSRVTFNPSTGVLKALALTSEGLTNKISDIIIAKGDKTVVPNPLTIDYVTQRVKFVKELRKSYSLSKLKSMLRTIDINAEMFYKMYTNDLWREKPIC